MTDNAVAAVLALVQGGSADVIETETPMPPAGSSSKASMLWYALLDEYEFSLGEMLILETLCATQTQLDEVEAAWRRDGALTTSEGSMGQAVVEPRIAEMRQLRNQIVSTMKALNLPAEGGQEKRRPGRPARSDGGGAWGTR